MDEDDARLRGSPTASEYMRVPSAEATYVQLGLYGVDIMMKEWLG